MEETPNTITPMLAAYVRCSDAHSALINTLASRRGDPDYNLFVFSRSLVHLSTMAVPILIKANMYDSKAETLMTEIRRWATVAKHARYDYIVGSDLLTMTGIMLARAGVL